MVRTTRGPLQVGDASVQAINLALQETQDQLDELHNAPAPATPVAAAVPTVAAGSGIAVTGTTDYTVAAQSYVFDQVTANVTVGNTAVETTIYTKQITGGTLGTTKGLRLTIMGTLTDSALDASTTMTFRFKYGATTVITQARTTDDGVVTFGGTGVWRFVFEVFADGATNAQLGWLSGVCPTIVAGATTFPAIDLRGTAVIDSTANQNLVVTAQWNAATANATMTMERATLELL